MIKLLDETEMKWRDLALQFDGHRMQAISLLKMIINDAPDDQFLSVRNFLESGPLPGEEVLRNRIAEVAEVQRLNATAQPVSDGCKITSEMIHAGICAMNKCSPSEAEDFGHQLYARYESEVVQIFKSMLKAAPGGQDD